MGQNVQGGSTVRGDWVRSTMSHRKSLRVLSELQGEDWWTEKQQQDPKQLLPPPSPLVQIQLAGFNDMVPRWDFRSLFTWEVKGKNKHIKQNKNFFMHCFWALSHCQGHMSPHRNTSASRLGGWLCRRALDSFLPTSGFSFYRNNVIPSELARKWGSRLSFQAVALNTLAFTMPWLIATGRWRLIVALWIWFCALFLLCEKE